jgi:hypothetical protein
MSMKTKVIIGIVVFSVLTALVKDYITAKLNATMLSQTTSVAVESVKETKLNTQASLTITNNLHKDNAATYSNLSATNSALDAKVASVMNDDKSDTKDKEVKASSILIDELIEYRKNSIERASP